MDYKTKLEESVWIILSHVHYNKSLVLSFEITLPIKMRPPLAEAKCVYNMNELLKLNCPCSLCGFLNSRQVLAIVTDFRHL